MNRKEQIKNIIDKFNLEKSLLKVCVVANIIDHTLNYKSNIICHANKDEMFSELEFAQILSPLSNISISIISFYSEIDYINFLINDYENAKEYLVYNLARDGQKEGKKSLIPSICDLMKIKYTGSNPFVISLLRNKYIWTCVLQQNNIKTPQTWKYNIFCGFDNIPPQCGTKLIAKMIHESASIGMNKENIFNYDEKKDFLTMICQKAKTDQLLVQEYIDGIECEVLVIKINNKFLALDPIQIVSNEDVLYSDISNDYLYGFNLLSNKINSQIIDQICQASEKAAQLLGIETYARFDFRIKKSGEFFLIDIAGTPYTINHSSIDYLFTKIYNLKREDIYKVIIYLSKQKNQ